MNAEKLTTPKDKVRQLQRKLYQSAKRNKVRKFHALYDKIYREDILYEAWKQASSLSLAKVSGNVNVFFRERLWCR